MSSKEIFEPDFWTLTGAQPAIMPFPLQVAPPRIAEMRSRQPTLMGVPKRRLSIWRMVAGMEAELMRAPRRTRS